MRLRELLHEFDGLEPEERLELLVELAETLPPVSPGRAQQRSEACRVQECQTPVYLWVDVVAGAARLEADVSRQSPTVRGVVALLVSGLEGAAPADVATVPDDLLRELGLQDALGMTRQHGVRGLVRRIKREVREAVARSGEV